MASRRSIEMDFMRAMNQADNVDKIADRLAKDAGGRLSENMQSLAAGWKGENASAYLQKGMSLQGKISASAGDLHGVASDIRRAARRIYNAEMAALAIAENRSW